MSGRISESFSIPPIPVLYAAGRLKAAGEAEKSPSASINTKVYLIRADITKLSLDAIVNAANSTLHVPYPTVIANHCLLVLLTLQGISAAEPA